MATRNELLLQQAYQRVIGGDKSTEALNNYNNLIKVVNEERAEKALKELNSISVSSSFRKYTNSQTSELEKAIKENDFNKIKEISDDVSMMLKRFQSYEPSRLHNVENSLREGKERERDLNLIAGYNPKLSQAYKTKLENAHQSGDKELIKAAEDEFSKEVKSLKEQKKREEGLNIIKNFSPQEYERYQEELNDPNIDPKQLNDEIKRNAAHLIRISEEKKEFEGQNPGGPEGYSSFTGTPVWYGQNAWEIAREGKRLGMEDYKPYQKERVAPFNELHHQNNKLLDYFLREHPELERSNKHIDLSNKSIMEQAQHHVKEAMKNPMEFKKEYMNAYDRDVIQALKEEAKENFLEEVAPHINMSFAQHGAFHSGARNEMLRKAAEKTKKEVNREIAKLLHMSDENAMQHSHLHQERHIKSGELLGNLQNAENLGHRQSGQAMLANYVAKKGSEQAGIGLQNQLAEQKKAQHQSEINAHLNEYEAQREHPWNQLQKQSQILHGHNLAQEKKNWHPESFAEKNSKLENVLEGVSQVPKTIGAIKDIYGLFKAKGGSVRSKFAQGGEVFKNNPYDEMFLKHAVALMEKAEKAEKGEKPREKMDWTDYLSMWGRNLSRNGRIRGRNSLVGAFSDTNQELEGKHAAQRAERLAQINSDREQGTNLYHKINKSLLEQQKVLAQYSQKERFHNENLAAKYAGIGAKPKKLDQVDREILTTANKQLMGGGDLIEDLDRLSTLSQQINSGGFLSSTPFLANPYVQSHLGQGQQEHMEEFDKIANDFVLKAASTFGNRAGAKIAEMFKSAKPHRGMSPKAIQNVIGNIKKKVVTEMERAQKLNEAYESGISPKMALNQYSHQNPVSKVQHSPPVQSAYSMEDRMAAMEELKRRAGNAS